MANHDGDLIEIPDYALARAFEYVLGRARWSDDSNEAPSAPPGRWARALLDSIESLDWQEWAMSAAFPLAWRPIERLDGLEHATNLKTVFLRGNRVRRLDALAEAYLLEELDISENPVAELSPLAGLPSLRVLTLDGSKVRDLVPTTRLPALEAITLSAGQADLEPLLAVKSLKRIKIWASFDPLPDAELKLLVELEMRGVAIDSSPAVLEQMARKRPASVPQGDAFADLLASFPDLLALYLKGPEARDRSGKTLVHHLIAAKDGPALDERITLLKHLAQAGADVSAQDYAYHAIPLLLACEPSVPEPLFDAILELTPDPNLSRHNPPLRAALERCPARVGRLVKRGADLRLPLVLHAIVERRAMELLDQALRQGADPNTQNDSGASLLDTALIGNDIGVATKLLDAGADPSRGICSCVSLEALKLVLDRGGDPHAFDHRYSRLRQTVLHSMRIWRTSDAAAMLDLLLSKGLNIDVRDSSGETPLARLIERGFSNRDKTIELARLLLARGADLARARDRLEDCDWAFEALGAAPRAGSSETLKLALNAEQPNTPEWSALRRAIHFSAREQAFARAAQIIPPLLERQGSAVAQVLLQGLTKAADSHRRETLLELAIEWISNDPDTNNDGGTPLHQAATIETVELRYELIQALLESGADRDARRWDGRSALAVLINHWDYVDHDSELDGKLISTLITPANARDLIGSASLVPEVLPLLVEHDVSVGNQRALDALIELGDPAWLERALSTGASPHDPVDASSNPPLARAAERGNLEIMMLLLDRGASPDGAPWNVNGIPLFKARTRPAVQLLIDRGANVHIRERGSCDTPLHYFAWTGAIQEEERPAILEALLDAGANPFDLNKKGETVIAALERNKKKVPEKLRALSSR